MSFKSFKYTKYEDLPAHGKISKVCTKLVTTEPFYSTLFYKLRVIEVTEDNKKIDTMATDGHRLFYNPAFVNRISEAECLGVICHELLHCAFLHMYRRGTRDPILWNIAGDLIINAILNESGQKLPEGGLLDTSFDWTSLTIEEAYAKLYTEAKKYSVTIQKGKSGMDSTGSFTDSDSGELDSEDPDSESGGSEQCKNTAGDWEIAREQAVSRARKQGKVPAAIERGLGTAKKVRPDWREQLRRFIQSLRPQDFSWVTPNKNYLYNDIYLPGIHKESCPPFVMSIDTSGSIDADLLAQFAAETNTIKFEVKPEKITIIYCDAAINHVEEFDLDEDVVLNPHGGGGTNFIPVFDYVEANMYEPPACLFYFTDLMGTFPENPPDYPVLWVVPEAYSDFNPPWGEKIIICSD